MTGVRSFTSFSASLLLRPYPVDEYTLCLYASSLANREISFNTIKIYLAGIQLQSIMLGFSVRFSNMARLYELLRGIRRTQGNSLRHIFENGDYLIRRYLAAFLKLALPNVTNINTHSFRIGGSFCYTLRWVIRYSY